MGLLTPRAGLFIGLGIAAVMLTTLALVVPSMGSKASPEAAQLGQGYVVQNTADDPVTYVLRLGQDGRVMGAGTLQAGESVTFPSTAGAADLWVRARWVEGTDVATCQDTTGAGYVILLRPDPYRVHCAGAPGTA